MKYFVVSDIHGFYDIMINSLNDAGYDKDNKNHTLIVCGDIFDRGKQPDKVYDFLKSIPKERKILIRGNHESLLRDMLKKDFPDEYDFSNRTVETASMLAGYKPDYIDRFSYLFGDEYGLQKWNIVCRKFPKEILDWIYSDEWVNYYETKDYIFVHSFIPVNDESNSPRSYVRNHIYTYRDDWRNATDTEWEDATWGCPWEQFLVPDIKKNLKKENKTLVVGHWHTSDFYENIDGDKTKYDICPIYNKNGLIGIDACTAHTKRINVFTFEE